MKIEELEKLRKEASKIDVNILRDSQELLDVLSIAGGYVLDVNKDIPFLSPILTDDDAKMAKVLKPSEYHLANGLAFAVRKQADCYTCQVAVKGELVIGLLPKYNNALLKRMKAKSKRIVFECLLFDFL